MSAVTKRELVHAMIIPIGTQAATATVPGPKLKHALDVSKVRLINGASLAVDDTNYLVVELKAGSTVLASFSTKATSPGKLCNEALVANVASGDMLGGTPIQIAAGTQLSVTATKNGTGVPTNAILQLE